MEFLKVILRGIGQVMFQNNALTGFFFLLGIAVNSWEMALIALFSTCIGTITAQLSSFSKRNIDSGLFGYNACLVGIGLFVLFENNWLLYVAIVLGSAFSSYILYMMQVWKAPPLTFPFVLSTWLLYAIMQALGFPLKLNLTDLLSVEMDVFHSIFQGVGQVFFQGNVWTGLLFVIGIFINSKKSGVYVLSASVLGMLLALLFSQPIALIENGIFGFNAVLCALLFDTSLKGHWYWPLIAVLLSVLITWGFLRFELPMLTAPFVFASWFVIWIKRASIKTSP